MPTAPDFRVSGLPPFRANEKTLRPTHTRYVPFYSLVNPQVSHFVSSHLFTFPLNFLVPSSPRSCRATVAFQELLS